MDILKGGWHPGGKGNSGNSNNNGGSKLSANFKGIDQVRGWMGHKSSSTKEAEGRANYASAPLSSLRDPSSFGAPPKHRAYYGTGADARIDGGIGGSSSSGVVSRREDSKALGAPLSRSEMPEQAQTREAEEQRAREEANLPLSPPKPYRVDTTGLSTSNLPKPPLFRGRPGQEQQLETQPPSLPLIARAAPPTPPQRPAHTKQQQQQRSPTAKPSLPPRLPLRQNPNPEQNAPPAPPTYKDATKQQQAPPRNPGSINRCVLDRLEAAGVNVPGLGIGAHKDDHSASSGPPARFADGPTSPQAPAWSQPQSVPAMTRGPELSELQSRFSRMSSSTAASLSPSNPSNSTGPSTSQLAGQGARMFNHWNQQQQQQQQQTTGIVNTRTGDTVDVAGSAQRTATTKKLPPPAPPKKKTLLDVQRGAGDGDGGGPSTPPPPIPLGSKPRTG